jgi:hypothetical protein
MAAAERVRDEVEILAPKGSGPRRGLDQLGADQRILARAVSPELAAGLQHILDTPGMMHQGLAAGLSDSDSFLHFAASSGLSIAS